MTFTRKRLGSGEECGINLTVITDSKLKTNNFTVHFITRLDKASAAANALTAFMLEDTCAEYPDITSFNRRLAQLYGAAIRSGIRRFGDDQVITLSLSCIADEYALNGEQITYEALKLLFGCILDPPTEKDGFPERQLELKRQELIDDINADINDKRSYAVKQARSVIYKGEPAGEDVRGSADDAAALTPQQAFKAYKELIKSARTEMFFVGKRLPEECEALIKSSFDATNRSEVFLPHTAHSPAKPAPEYLTEHMDVAQSKMVMAFKHTGSEKSAYTAKVFNAVFGATPFSMLFKNVRERMSLCYYCPSAFNEKKFTVSVDCGVDSKNISAAQSEIVNQLRLIGAGEFTEELLSRSKLYIVSALKGVKDSPRATEGWYFDQCLLPESEILSPEDYIERIEAVTHRQVCEFASSLVLDTVYLLTGKEETA